MNTQRSKSENLNKVGKKIGIKEVFKRNKIINNSLKQ